MDLLAVFGSLKNPLSEYLKKLCVWLHFCICGSDLHTTVGVPKGVCVLCVCACV